jgi:hypothetical protein
MPADGPKAPTKSDKKSARMRDTYRKVLEAPDLADREIDDMRQNVIRLAQALCEHVWGNRLY